MRRLAGFWVEVDVQDLIEYSLLLMFVAIAALALVTGSHSATEGIWNANTNHLVQADRAAGGG